MEFKELKYIYNASGEPNSPTLLLLHGTGGDESDLLPLAKHFGNNLNILSVRGNVDENGMPRFFKRLGMGIFDEADVRFRTHELVHFITKIAQKEKFDDSKIIALGYSNGANIAGAVLMLYPEFLSAAILLRPMQPLKDASEAVSTTLNQPVFMSSGQADSTVNPAATEKYVALLKESGFNVTHHNLPTGHNLSQQDVVLATSWFKEYFIEV